jgi:hypothetical protein
LRTIDAEPASFAAASAQDQDEAIMADNPLFYHSITPLDRVKHRGLRLKNGADRFAFASKTHIIPAVIDEFAMASRHLPIVFLPASPLPAAVFLVGLRPGQNVFVNAEGGWSGGYIPAFARRYPFMLGELDKGGTVACIDETYDGLNQTIGERLFAEDGSDTPLLTERIKLINDYFAAAKRTDGLAKTLNELRLLRGVTIESKLDSGSSAALHGCLTVDEAKLNALPEADFLRLRSEGLLPAIYAHLLSLASVDRLQRTEAASESASQAQGAVPAKEANGAANQPKVEAARGARKGA